MSNFIACLHCLLLACLSAQVAEFSVYKKENLASMPYLVSEKFDGVRGVWDGKELKTKRGNVINAPQCFLRDFPPFALDGELWIDYGKFEEVASITARLNASCEDYANVKYKIFDAPTCGAQSISESSTPDSECLLSERLERVQNFITLKKPKHIELITQEILRLDKISDKEFEIALDSKLQKVVSVGGEGLILRPDERGYKRGRAKNAFKLKPYNDAECKVIGHTPGRGKFAGKMGALICQQELSEQSDIGIFLESSKAKKALDSNKDKESKKDSKDLATTQADFIKQNFATLSDGSKTNNTDSNNAKHNSNKDNTRRIDSNNAPSAESSNANASNTSKQNFKNTKNHKSRVITFKIGTGFSEAMRENPPKIGTIITYKYNGFNKNGLPKNAVFLKELVSLP